MGDMTADYKGKAWYKKHPTTETFNRVVKAAETCNYGEIVEEDTGECLPFDVSDGKEILGIFMSNKTTGDATGTDKDKGGIWTKFTLVNCYISGSALGDEEKPIWAGGATPGCNASSGDLSLTYMAGGKLLGFHKKHRTTDTADIWVDPMRLIRKKVPAGHVSGADGSVPAAAGFFGIMADMHHELIVRAHSYVPEIVQTAVRGYDVVVVVGGNVLTGTLSCRNADTVHTESEAAVTDHANCHVPVGTEVKLEVDAHEGAAPNAGESDHFIEFDEVPKCSSIG